MGSNELLYIGTNSIAATAYIGILRAVSSVDLGSNTFSAAFNGASNGE